MSQQDQKTLRATAVPALPTRADGAGAAESRRKRRFSWPRKAAAAPFGGASRPPQLG